jgi:hypothetical protein
LSCKKWRASSNTYFAMHGQNVPIKARLVTNTIQMESLFQILFFVKDIISDGKTRYI